MAGVIACELRKPVANVFVSFRSAEHVFRIWKEKPS